MNISRQLSSRDVENTEKKDIKHRIESNIELQSSPEPEKEAHIRVIFVLLSELFPEEIKFISD